MYTPSSYREDDPAVLHDLIRRYNFATLFTPESAQVTHLPFLLETDRGPHGTLVSHMARANPHWKSLEGARESIVVFLGAHSYISPGWYDRQTDVPTWNYAAVHVRGAARLVTDEAKLRDMLEILVDVHETPVGCPWDKEHMEEAVERNLPGIVGFEIEIEKIEGKFKFNQGRSRADRERVVAALENADDTVQREVAGIMRKNLDGEK